MMIKQGFEMRQGQPEDISLGTTHFSWTSPHGLVFTKQLYHILTVYDLGSKRRRNTMKRVSVVLVVCLILSPVVAGAFDYKAWIPLLPKTMGGMMPSGSPDGMNMEMGGQKWSSITQEYKSKDGRKTAQFSVIAGQMAPQVQGFQSMVAMNMSMETGDQIIKTTTVSGKKALVVVDKKNKTGTLTVPVKENMVVAITMEPATSVSDLTSMVQYVSLSSFQYAR